MKIESRQKILVLPCKLIICRGYIDAENGRDFALRDRYL